MKTRVGLRFWNSLMLPGLWFISGTLILSNMLWGQSSSGTAFRTHETNYSVTAQPSPTTASLGEFIHFPPGSNTGTVPYSIDLGQIQEKDFSIPLSLQYHNGGIRVNQEASWVGMGWSLGGGGAITRSVKGLPDDQIIRKNEFLDNSGISRKVWKVGWLYPYSGRKIAQTYPNVTPETEYLQFTTFPYLPLVHAPMTSCPTCAPNGLNWVVLNAILGLNLFNQHSIVEDINNTSVSFGKPYHWLNQGTNPTTNQPLMGQAEITRRTGTDREGIILQNMSANLGVPIPNFVPNGGTVLQYPVFDDINGQCCGNDLDSMDTRISTLDSEPDIYYINAPGLTAKFVFDEEGQARVLSDQNLEISYFLDDIDNPLPTPFSHEDIINGAIQPEDYFGKNLSKFVVKTDAGRKLYF